MLEVARIDGPGGELLEVTISNSGPPLPREILPTLFERFVRDRNSSGLGLYLAHEIIVAHGDTVAAEPLVDGARRFRVRLPMT